MIREIRKTTNWWEKVEMMLKTVTPLYSVLDLLTNKKMKPFLVFFQK
jgi:hypothetical protein